MNMRNRLNYSGGYTLIEVLVGILIFAVGMMALAQLQTNLAQNSGDANARTIAMNIAEGIIERDRSFSVIFSAEKDEANPYAFEDIVPETITPSDAEVAAYGLDYTVDKMVTSYYFQPDGTFGTSVPAGAVVPDFKKVELTVNWVGTPGAEDLGSGSITVNEVISSATSGAGGKAALGAAASSMYQPEVDYNPGKNPDIVSISLGDNKFKESTTPLPDVIRADELVETRFDVVTYSQISEEATFLRREEFIAVSCECTLRVPSLDGEGGLRPTSWNGEDYTEGEFVEKPFGVSASNQQSQFCDVCCRDHHDGGIGGTADSARYNPFRSTADYYDAADPVDSRLIGNHKHYNRDNSGNLQLASQDGDRYVEACRLVRKDGFFRVAQDLHQQGLNSFPADFLDDDADLEVYSDYVTGAVLDYYSGAAASMPTAADEGYIFPASTKAEATTMSDPNLTSQQLRSRGIYIDYMTDELRCKINRLPPFNLTGDCEAPENVGSALEIIPFYDVQLTWLSRWTETPTNYPIDVTNEPIADDNSHSRGVASLVAGFGYSTVNSSVHGGNLGLTGTDPIDERFLSETKSYNLFVLAVDPSATPDPSGVQINGMITSAVPGVKAADVAIEWDTSQAACDRNLLGFECTILANAENPWLRVSNYEKAGKVLYACSSELGDPDRYHANDNPSEDYATFTLPTAISMNVTIVIKEGGC
jgi:prepilin-type N-terminal cleavage/methylation domain-containing protein